jgi:3-hydroxyisobutyrate dehydrogenase-like beta-hydroxyacid dehydrogenase
MTERIGLIGLGLVGMAIAERLLAEGYEVWGCDIDADRCEDAESLGVKVCESPADVGRRARRVMLSLPGSDVVGEVAEGPGGLVESEPLPRYVLDTTTGDPERTAALAQRLAEQGISFLDAPFSGSSEQVRAKEVVFMVGGDQAAFEVCRDIFEKLGGRTFYLGPSGSGSRAKLASNLVLGLNRLTLAEGLVFAKELGLEPEGFLELLKATPAYSAAMDAKGKKMVCGDFEPQARLRQHHKDVSIILRYAQKLRQELPLSKAHCEVLERAIAAGDGDLDNSAVIREIRRRGKGT